MERLRASAAALAVASLMVSTAVMAPACSPAMKEAPAAGGEMSSAVVDPYLNIHLALAQDSLDGIRQNAGMIATAATALGAPAMKIDTAAVALAAADDLPTARAKFGDLSEAIDTYMTGFRLKPPSDVRKAFCPMANKPWLQKGSMVANPYYGKDMPTCGEFK